LIGGEIGKPSNADVFNEIGRVCESEMVEVEVELEVEEEGEEAVMHFWKDKCF